MTDEALTPEQLQERIAREIDPEAWRTPEQFEEYPSANKRRARRKTETLDIATAILALLPSTADASKAFARGAREGWMRAIVSMVDMDAEGDPEMISEMDRRWPDPDITSADIPSAQGKDGGGIGEITEGFASKDGPSNPMVPEHRRLRLVPHAADDNARSPSKTERAPGAQPVSCKDIDLVLYKTAGLPKTTRTEIINALVAAGIVCVFDGIDGSKGSPNG